MRTWKVIGSTVFVASNAWASETVLLRPESIEALSIEREEEEEPCDCGTIVEGECAPCPPEDDGYPQIREDLDTPIDLESLK